MLAAVIGFASQKAFANIIGGLFILIFKPFRVHDTIEISNNRRGTVEEITLRHTVIKDYEHKRIIIPNSQISEETIINSSITDDKIRKQIEIEIAYTVDIDKASAIIIEEISKSQFMIDNRTPEDIENGLPLVAINVLKLGVYSITLRANAWTNNANDAFALQCEVYKSIKERFDSENIEIPYPYNNVILKK